MRTNRYCAISDMRSGVVPAIAGLIVIDVIDTPQLLPTIVRRNNSPPSSRLRNAQQSSRRIQRDLGLSSIELQATYPVQDWNTQRLFRQQFIKLPLTVRPCTRELRTLVLHSCPNARQKLFSPFKLCTHSYRTLLTRVKVWWFR